MKYSSPSERMFAPFQRIWPSAGASRPQRIRSKLVFPLPFGPVNLTNVPAETEKSRPLKSLRSPRTQPSCLTSSINSLQYQYSALLRYSSEVLQEKHTMYCLNVKLLSECSSWGIKPAFELHLSYCGNLTDRKLEPSRTSLNWSRCLKPLTPAAS